MVRYELVAELMGELREERDRLIEELQRTQRRIRGIDKLLEGYAEAFPDLGQRPTPSADEVIELTPDSSYPRGQEAVLRVLEDPQFRGRYWTPAQMTDELISRGWPPESEQPANAVRAALVRVADVDHRVHRGKGRNGNFVYFFQAEGADPPHFDSPDDDIVSVMSRSVRGQLGLRGEKFTREA